MNTTIKPKHHIHIPKKLSNHSYPELLSLKGELEQEIAEIKLQFAHVRTTLAETGQYADSGWYARANYALRVKGVKLQAIQNELSRRKREKKSGNLSTYFLLVARHWLTGEVFADILQEAKELLYNGNSPESHQTAG